MDSLLPILSSVRWQDVVDIIINSYILFRIYVLFRGTNIFHVLFGVTFLWFFQRMAVSAGLIVSSWVLQGFTAVAAFIIIIVFRNEIRSFLLTKNLWSLIWGVPRKTTETPLEIIAESVFKLAGSRIGGLIVLPGKENLEDVTHSGIPWGGLVSREMIKSIFWQDNPVHDGAAIIQGNRVSEVAVILPLSHRKDLPSDYSTRHRAAAGLAEKTDALVIVVSEERGSVNIAKGPHMSVIKDREDLIDILKDHTGTAAAEPGDPKSRFKLGMAALFSILIIGGVWYSFNRGLDTMITLEVPVAYINRDMGKEIIGTSVNSVQLYLSGTAAIIRSIRAENVKVRIDLESAKVGTNVFFLTKENIFLPPKIFLSHVKPSVVEVTLDELIKKDLPLQVDWVGKLPENLLLVSAKIYPEMIQVIGGRRMLKDITTIYSEEVLLDDIKKNGRITVKPVLDSLSLSIDVDSKQEITVEYVVKERSDSGEGLVQK